MDQDWRQVIFKKPQANMKKSNPYKKNFTDEQVRLNKIEHEEFIPPKISKQLSKQIQQARNAKKMSRAQLAQQINMKQSVIDEYENGKAIPNQQVLNRIERALNVKLRGNKPK